MEALLNSGPVYGWQSVVYIHNPAYKEEGKGEKNCNMKCRGNRQRAAAAAMREELARSHVNQGQS